MASNTQVTDAGLKHLRGLKNLRFLLCGGTRVTRDGLIRLKKDIPDLVAIPEEGVPTFRLPVPLAPAPASRPH